MPLLLSDNHRSLYVGAEGTAIIPGGAIRQNLDGDGFFGKRNRVVSADSLGATRLSNLTSSPNLPINRCRKMT